ncbi:MAG: O-antigen ligase family protein [Flavobacteriaceae bacterium]
MNPLQHINLGNLICLFAFFLPISEKASTMVILGTVIFVIWENLIKKVKLSKKDNFNLLALAALFLVYVISLFFFSKNFDIKFLEMKLSLIAFPFIFYFNPNINKQQIIKYFVYGTAVAYFICIGNAIQNSFILENGVYVFHPLKTDSRTFFEAIVYEGNNFFGKYFSFLYHNTYFAIYLTFSFLILLLQKNSFNKGIFYLLVVIFPLGVIQTMSRAGFGSLLIVLLLLIIFKIKKLRLKILLFGLFFLTIGIAFTIHPRLHLLVDNLISKGIELNPNGMDGHMLRLLSWDAALNVIKESPIYGAGIADAQDTLEKAYHDKGYIHPLQRNLNAHNQFLQIYIECGIIGLLALLALFWKLLKSIKDTLGENRILLISFIALMAFNFMFESMLNRYLGISFFSFFFCLLIYDIKSKRQF